MFIPAARVTTSPSITLPEHIVQINQVSGYMECLATGNPEVRLGSEDLWVYANVIDMATQVSAGQVGSNQLPSVMIKARQISLPSYLVQGRNEFDHHQTANASDWGFSLTEAYRLGARQGAFQKFRDSGLYGFNPTNGEGLINSAAVTTMNAPADTYGNTTVLLYDNGQAAQLFIQIIKDLKTRTMSGGEGVDITILGPQRTLMQFEYNVVQVTQYQRPGAGTESSVGVLKNVVGESDDTITWTYDDTLIGKGAGGNDLIIITMPTLKVRQGGKINTNEFAKLTPNMAACNRQFCDMIAPREITAPLPGGAADVYTEIRMTPGWNMRPEVVTLLSWQYQ